MIHSSVKDLFDQVKVYFDEIKKMAEKDQYQVELLLTQGESLTVKYKKQNLDSFTAGQDMTAGFRVLSDGVEGYSYTEKVNREGLLACYKEALKNALTKKAELGVIEKKVTLVKPAQKEISFQLKDYYFDEEVAQADLQEAAKKLEKICLDFDKRITNVPYNLLSESLRSAAIFNSEGVDQRYSQRYIYGYNYALAEQGSVKKMGGEDFFVRSWKSLDVDKVAKAGAEIALSRLAAVRPKTGTYAVLFDLEVSSALLTMLSDYFSGKSILEKKSLFEGKLNQKVAQSFIQIDDDPFIVDSPASRPFDSEGTLSQKTTLVQNGVLKNYLTHSLSAQALNLPNTGHGSRGPTSSLSVSCTNLIVHPGSKSREELLAVYDEVIYITEFAGSLHAGFKESTGDFSMPAEGFIYRSGQQVGPIDQFVVSGNIIELFMNIKDLGSRSGKTGSSMRCPDLLVPNLSIAGA